MEATKEFMYVEYANVFGDPNWNEKYAAKLEGAGYAGNDALPAEKI